MKEFIAVIDQQLQFNRKKNLLCQEPLSDFSFSPAMVSYLSHNITKFRTMETQEGELILDLLTTKAIEALCVANQYFYFNSFDRDALKKIYRKLIQDIGNLQDDAVAEGLHVLAKRHYQVLQRWVKTSNPFVKSLYPTNAPHLEQEVVCSEYSAQAQLQLLAIDMSNLLEPVLDLGCGKEAFLVKHFRDSGIAAFGVDRSAAASDYLFQADWFEFNLSGRSWGTIISNLGFSNHFLHHHYRVDGDYHTYALRYMEILRSLQKGGAFYYAPDLPFMEQHLDAAQFLLQRVTVEGTQYSASKVLKI